MACRNFHHLFIHQQFSSFHVKIPVNVFVVVYYRPQLSWGKVIFSQASVILFTGGSTWAGTPPGPGTPPLTRYPLDQVHPLGPGTPPGTRYTPSPGTHPPGPGTPPWTRYTPWDQVHPQGPGTPPNNQVHPPRRYGQQAGGTHPTGMYSC